MLYYFKKSYTPLLPPVPTHSFCTFVQCVLKSNLPLPFIKVFTLGKHHFLSIKTCHLQYIEILFFSFDYRYTRGKKTNKLYARTYNSHYVVAV